jgi:hypothetical protein
MSINGPVRRIGGTSSGFAVNRRGWGRQDRRDQGAPTTAIQRRVSPRRCNAEIGDPGAPPQGLGAFRPTLAWRRPVKKWLRLSSTGSSAWQSAQPARRGMAKLELKTIQQPASRPLGGRGSARAKPLWRQAFGTPAAASGMAGGEALGSVLDREGKKRTVGPRRAKAFGVPPILPRGSHRFCLLVPPILPRRLCP